ASDAFVAAWLPGSEGLVVADVLLRQANEQVNYNFSGQLSYSWPATPQQTAVNRFDKDYQPLLPYGFGLKYGQKGDFPTQQLSNHLSEINAGAVQELQALALFDGVVKAPWQLFIGNKDSQQLIDSAVQHNNIVSLRTIDRQVQEDARQIDFNGKGMGSVAFTSNFPEDYLSYLETKSALSLTIKVNKAASGPVMLSMRCLIECDKQIDLTSALVGLDDWQTITVDLACLDPGNSGLGKVFSPFLLSTSAQFSLSFADIAIKPQSAKLATISCQP
ncbi:MAG: glycoside hydrolase family 3 protein, partial [Psychrosphaera sp.]|nr:glycoside hydrolase family 3 protein [Psychrosphaera sp.]